MRSVGVTCTPRLAYLTLAIDGAIDGAIADTPVERVEVAAQYESSEELLSTLDGSSARSGSFGPTLNVRTPRQRRLKPSG